MVTEDDEPVAERRLGGGDAIDELVVGREGVVVREWSLETQHVGPPRCGVQLLVGRRVAARSPAPRGCRPRSSVMETPDTGPACRHHNTHVEWKAARYPAPRPLSTYPCRRFVRRFADTGFGVRVARAGFGRRSVAPARDNGGVVARPETGSIPDAPGSYQFLDAEGRVIYVGKAKSLRSRLSNYFAAARAAARPHPPDGDDGRDRSSGSSPRTRSRPSSWSSTSSSSTSPASTSA